MPDPIAEPRTVDNLGREHYISSIMKVHPVVLALVGLALVAGTFLRLEDMSIMEFKADEGRLLVIANKWIVRGVIPATGGRTSVGGYFAPLFSYLLSIPYVFCRDPVWVTLWIALFNVLGLFLCYLMVRRFWGERVAVVSVILFALSPWAVLYSRKIWNPNVCPPLTILFIYSLLAILVDKKNGYFFPLLLSWLILVQLHPVYLVLGIVPAVAFIIYRPAWKWYHLAAALLLGLVPLVVSIRFLWLRGHDLAGEIGALLLMGGRSEIVPLAESLTHAWKIPFVMNLSFFGLNNLLGAAVWASLARGCLPMGLNLAEHLLVILGLFIVGRGALDWRRRRSSGRRPDPREIVLILWFLVPSLIFGFTRKVLGPHYFSVLYPSQFILAGLAFEWLWCPSLPTSVRRGMIITWRCALVLLICGIAVSQALFVYSFYRVVEKEGGTSGDYGTAYIQKERAVDYVLGRSGGKPFSIVLDFDSGDFLDEAYRYLLLGRGEKALPAGAGIDCYVIWDPYRWGNRGRYPREIPEGWAEVARLRLLRVYWRPASKSGK